MTAPPKATPAQWEKVRLFAEENSWATDLVLLEVADRVAALEAAFASHGEQISGLHSQHNLVVDTITNLQGCVNQLEAVTSASPATEKSSVAAPDHFPDTTGMVATDEELYILYDTRRLQARSTTAALRAIYNLDRQHGVTKPPAAQPIPPSGPAGGSGPQPTPPPARVISNPAAIGRFGEWLAREMPPGTVIGQPMHWAPRIVCAVLNACQEGETAPSPAPAGDPVAAPSGLVERVLRQLPSGTDPVFARQALLEVAEWADQQGLRRTMRRLREEADR